MLSALYYNDNQERYDIFYGGNELGTSGYGNMRGHLGDEQRLPFSFGGKRNIHSRNCISPVRAFPDIRDVVILYDAAGAYLRSYRFVYDRLIRFTVYRKTIPLVKRCNFNERRSFRSHGDTIPEYVRE